MDKREYDDLKTTLQIVEKIDNLSRKQIPDPIKRLSYLNKKLPELMGAYSSKLSNITDLKLFRGFASELIMTNILEVLRTQCRVQVKQGLIIPTSEGTAQLDHLIMTPTHGIVIEVKHVYGDIYVDGVNMTVKNDFEERNMTPWNQNLYHIYKLKEYLKLTNLFFYNVVFVYGNYNLKKFSPAEGNYLLEYKQSIKNLKSMVNAEPPFKPNKSDINRVVGLINNLPELSIYKHIKEVERI